MRLAWVLLFTLPLAGAPLELSLKRAVQLAISPEGNTRVQLSAEALKQAESRSVQARSALLPDVSGAFIFQNLTRNLAALGIQVTTPIPGFQVPEFVGPFSTMDARVSATQSIFDLSSYRRFQASKVGVSAARAEFNGSEEQVAAQVARSYLAAVRADADVEAVKANVSLSEAVLQQAENQKAAGTGTGIEITRARVQLANDRQRLLVAENTRRAAGLQLLRGIGLRLDSDLVLTDKLRYIPVDAVTLEQAKARATKERPDLEAQQERESTARLTDRAVKAERLPTLSAFGDYGASGTGFDGSLPTRTVGISMRVSLFDGWKRECAAGGIGVAIPRREGEDQRPAGADRTGRTPGAGRATFGRRTGEGIEGRAGTGGERAGAGAPAVRRRSGRGRGSNRRAKPAGARARQPDQRALQLQRGQDRPGAGDGHGPAERGIRLL